MSRPGSGMRRPGTSGGARGLTAPAAGLIPFGNAGGSDLATDGALAYNAATDELSVAQLVNVTRISSDGESPVFVTQELDAENGIVCRGGLAFFTPGLLIRLLLKTSTKTTNYTLDSSETDFIVFADATAGPRDITLPPAALNAGRILAVKRINAGGNAVTVKSNGGTIDGVAAATGIALDAQYMSRMFMSDGTNWHVVAGLL